MKNDHPSAKNRATLLRGRGVIKWLFIPEAQEFFSKGIKVAKSGATAIRKVESRSIA